jgi:hypothetical protein
VLHFQNGEFRIFRFFDNNSKTVRAISKKIDHRQWEGAQIKGCEFHQNRQDKSKNRKKKQTVPLMLSSDKKK